jgi:hypothetical protein
MGFLNDYFKVSDSKAPVVELDQALHDDRIIEAFVPVKSTLEVFSFLKDATSLHASTSRAVLCHGAYGSGKSYMVAVLCRMFREGLDHPSLQPIWDRMKTRGWESHLSDLEKVVGQGDDFTPWLVVPLYSAGEGATLENALLKNLITQLRAEELEPQNIIGATWYEAAANRLRKMLEHDVAYQPLSGGVFATAQDLLKALEEDQDETAFAELEAWHKKAALGADLRDTLQAAGICNVGEAFAKASANIQAHGYKGILVLWDEFGFALEQLLKGHNSGQRNLGSEVMALQQFLEKSCGKNITGGGHVAFMGFTHFAMAEYGSRAQLQTLDADTFKRVTDRFHKPDIRIRLEVAEAEGYHLLSGMISPTDKGRELMENSFPNWKRLAQAMPDYEMWGGMEPTHILRDILKPTYPLHPATASILLRLSDNIAQMNRTAFYYMADKTNGLHAQLREKEMPSREKIGSSELIRPHELFPFFSEALQENKKALFKNYEDAVRKVPSEDEEMLALLRYVLILSVANINVTTDMLCFCLADAGKADLAAAEVNAALDRCAKAKALSKNSYTDIWSYGVAGIDIEEIIEEEEREIVVKEPAKFIRDTTSIKEELADYLGLFDLSPAGSGIIRRVRVEIPSLNSWNFEKLPAVNPSVASAGDSWCSAVLYLIVPDSDQMVRGWRERVAQCAPSESYFMIPDRAVEITGDIKRFAAVIRILERGDLDSERQVSFEDEFAHLRSSLRKEFNRYFGAEGFKSGTEIFKAGQSQPVFNVTNWYDLFAQTAKSVGQQCDREIKARCPSLNEWQDSKKAVLKNIAGAILRFEEDSSVRNQYLGFNESSLEAAVVDGVLIENGLMTKGLHGEWELLDAGNKDANLSEIMSLIRGYMTSGGSKKKNLQKLFNDLIEPPYGIPNGLIPILVALAIRKDSGRLTFYNANGNPIAHSSLPDELAKIISQPQKCSFRYEKLTGTNRVVFRALGAAIQCSVLSRELSGESFTAKCKEICSLLRNWAGAFADMVPDLGVLLPEEREFIVGLRRAVPLDAKDISDLAINMFKVDEYVAQELIDVKKSQESFPEAERFWLDLNERIRLEVSESRTIVETQIEEIESGVLELLGVEGGAKPDNVDEFTSAVTGKTVARLEKADYRYVQGKLDLVKEMQAQNASISLILPTSVEKVERCNNPEAEQDLEPLLQKLREKHELTDKELAAICLKLIYKERAFCNYSTGDAEPQQAEEQEAE